MTKKPSKQDVKRLKVAEQSESGLNTVLINKNTNRKIPLQQAINQIEKGNPTYNPYMVSQTKDGTKFVKAKPNNDKNDNIEPK